MTSKHDVLLEELHAMKLTLKSFRELLKKHHMDQLSGNSWIIPIDVVKRYHHQGSFQKQDDVLQEGGSVILSHVKDYIFRLW